MMERDEDTFAASGKTVYRDCINWSNNDHCAKTKANYCHPDCGDYRQLVKLVKRPETLEEIEADLRNDNRRFSNSTGAVIAQRIEAARKRMEWTHKKELETRDAVIQTEVAAREAEREAHKREMKETVRLVSRVAEEMTRGTAKGVAPTRKEVDAWAVRLYDIIDITLLAPARNCDRFNSGNAERDAEMAWDAITSGMDLQFSDLTDREIAIIKEAMRGFVWLFTSADESEAQA